VMLLSGSRTASDDQSQGLEMGADGYVARPIPNRELLARVEAMMRIIRAERERDRLIQELQAAMASIKTLKGLLPICASCKKIRNDKGYWQQVESYLAEHAEVRFSHGICPDCMVKLYPEFVDELDDEKEGPMSPDAKLPTVPRFS
jgi:phosphoserine phosphatase RsbU/P